MAVRYFFEFNDIAGNAYRGEISNSDSNETIEVSGSAVIQTDLSENIFQPIQAKTVNISLIANVDQPLEDIYNEEDRFWLFTLFKDSLAIFQGYVSTEDMEQSYSSSVWQLNFDALGHLGYLEDIGFYDDSGLPHTGIDSLHNIFIKCLNKGFNLDSERFDIRTTHYLTKSGGNIFTDSYLDQGQFYDENGEAQDCKTVLEDIIKSLGCYIFQDGLKWYICSVVQWVDLLATDITFNEYDPDGVFQGTFLLESDSISQRIGDHINDIPTYHINSNQVFIKKKFYNTFRINHVFDYALQILPNGELLEDTGTMPFWTLTADASVNGDSIEIDGVQLDASKSVALTSSTVSLKKDDVLEVVIDVEYFDDPNSQEYEILLTNTTSGNDYSYLLNQPLEDAEAEGRWIGLPAGSLVNTTVDLKVVEGEAEHAITLGALPENGDLYINVFTPVFGNAYNASTSKTQLNSISLKSKEQPIESEIFTYSRIGKSNGKVPDNYEVRFNTSGRNILRNIFVDSSGVAIPYFQNGLVDSELNDELGRTFIQLFSSNYNIFTGDIYNNTGLTPKRIDFLGATYIVTYESKDLASNISSTTLVQVSSDAPSFAKETERIFKEAIEPTIVN